MVTKKQLQERAAKADAKTDLILRRIADSPWSPLIVAAWTVAWMVLAAFIGRMTGLC